MPSYLVDFLDRIVGPFKTMREAHEWARRNMNVDYPGGYRILVLHPPHVIRTGEDRAWCADCGEELELVRPGKHQHVGECRHR